VTLKSQMRTVGDCKALPLETASSQFKCFLVSLPILLCFVMNSLVCYTKNFKTFSRTFPTLKFEI
jgi:hypothetical protein